jgi:L-fuconolactonase
MSEPVAIDAHQHFWSVARKDYHWMTPQSGVLLRDYRPEDLEPLLVRRGIVATILVQAAQTEEETRYLLEVAEATPFVAGVVGWVDFTAPSAPTRIREFCAHPLLVGLRPMVQDIEDDDWLLRRDIAPAIEAMVEHHLVFDALVHPRHLPRLAAFLDRYPDLPVVLDHGAKPLIRDRILDPWRADIAAIAARGQTLCKVSGLITEADASWTEEDLRPYVAHLISCFTPRRLMWGSDWPVLNVAGTYDCWLDAANALLSGFSLAQRSAVFGGNAAAFYLSSRGRRLQPGGFA